MGSGLWVRIAVVAVALFAASFISFPSFPSTGMLTPAPSVNRALKGDRLPSLYPAVWPHELGFSPAKSRQHGKVPVGCDAAFSQISAPRLADVFGRCTA